MSKEFPGHGNDNATDADASISLPCTHSSFVINKEKHPEAKIWFHTLVDYVMNLSRHLVQL
jgi:hypothetical protein